MLDYRCLVDIGRMSCRWKSFPQIQAPFRAFREFPRVAAVRVSFRPGPTPFSPLNLSLESSIVCLLDHAAYDLAHSPFCGELRPGLCPDLVKRYQPASSHLTFDPLALCFCAFAHSPHPWLQSRIETRRQGSLVSCPSKRTTGNDSLAATGVAGGLASLVYVALRVGFLRSTTYFSPTRSRCSTRQAHGWTAREKEKGAQKSLSDPFRIDRRARCLTAAALFLPTRSYRMTPVRRLLHSPYARTPRRISCRRDITSPSEESEETRRHRWHSLLRSCQDHAELAAESLRVTTSLQVGHDTNATTASGPVETKPLTTPRLHLRGKCPSPPPICSRWSG